MTFANAYIHTENLSELRIHVSGKENGELSEKETVLRTSEYPGSGIRRDLVLRGFWGELEHFLRGGEIDRSENKEVTEMIEEVLSAL